MKTKLGIVLAGFGLCCVAVPVAGHHSWVVDYDLRKPFTVKGVVTKIEWTNPHSHLYVDSTDEKRTVTRWTF